MGIQISNSKVELGDGKAGSVSVDPVDWQPKLQFFHGG